MGSSVIEQVCSPVNVTCLLCVSRMLMHMIKQIQICSVSENHKEGYWTQWVNLCNYPCILEDMLYCPHFLPETLKTLRMLCVVKSRKGAVSEFWSGGWDSDSSFQQEAQSVWIPKVEQIRLQNYVVQVSFLRLDCDLQPVWMELLWAPACGAQNPRNCFYENNLNEHLKCMVLWNSSEQQIISSQAYIVSGKAGMNGDNVELD